MAQVPLWVPTISPSRPAGGSGAVLDAYTSGPPHGQPNVDCDDDATGEDDGRHLRTFV
jgi:hypothetical protein